MKKTKLKIQSRKLLADQVYDLRLSGDVSAISAPGQFINIELPGFFLRRPISVCDVCDEDTVRILYKVAGRGTELLSALPEGTELDVLTGLGNGFDTGNAGDRPLLIGGGIGSAPMLMLAKSLSAEGKSITAVLGFNSEKDIILEPELSAYGRVTVLTADGSHGTKGLVSDILQDLEYSYFYACGPGPMLKAVYRAAGGDGEFSFEERMGCGFGACMGCSMETASGMKRICKDGPVFRKGELLWKD